MDLNAFYNLGFTRNEASVYLSLVEQGRSPAHLLAKRLKLPRSTIYSVLAVLQQRKLVRAEKVRGATHFRVDSPDDLLHNLQEEEKKIRERQYAATSLVQELKQIFQSSAVQSPRVEFFEGKTKVERFLFDNLDRWTDSMLRTDKSTWGYQDHTFVQMFPAWIKRAWQVIHERAGIPGRILSNRSAIEQSLRGKIPRRQVRVLGSDINFESSFWVMGEYVILIMTREDPIYAFQIHDRLLAANLKAVFHHLYDQAAEV